MNIDKEESKILNLNILSKNEKIIKISKLSLWNYRGNFIFSTVCIALTICLLLFVNENNINLWMGNGVDGILASYRYNLFSLLLNYTDKWWFNLLKLFPLILVYNTISNLITGYLSLSLILTNNRIIVLAGIVNNDIIDFKLNNIESLRIHKDISGVIYKYGDITIIGNGNSMITLQGIKHPESFKRAYDNAISKYNN